MGSLDLTLTWAGIIVFAVMAYVVLDGFDLGITLRSGMNVTVQ